MIQFSQVPELIENSGLNCFKVTDMKGNKIIEFKGEDNTTEDALHKLEDLEPMLTSQGRFKIFADHWNSCKSNWTGSHQWTVEMPGYEGPSSGYSVGRGFAGNMGMNMQMMQMMMDSNAKVSEMQLEKQREGFDYMRELDSLRGEIAETEKSIIPPKYDKWVDLLIMRQAKIKPEELMALGQVYGQGGDQWRSTNGGWPRTCLCSNREPGFSYR